MTGEPVRLRPALYGDILRRQLSAHTSELQGWREPGVVSHEEADRLQAVHRRILADEDHWIVDARRLTIPHTILNSSTWLVVVASLLMVWKLRDELSVSWRCFLPVFASICLTGVGWLASRRKDQMAVAAFLAAAVLSVAPALAACLAELAILAHRPEGLRQLLAEGYTNHQLLAASVIAFGLSLVALRQLRITGFAWTSCIFLIGSHLLLRLELVSPRPFIIGMGAVGLIVALLSYAYLIRAPRMGGVEPADREGQPR